MFDFKCKIIHQYVVINGSEVIGTSDKVWIVQNGQYLTYPKIDHVPTWNFSLILSIFDFECKNRPKCYNQWQRHCQYKCQGLDNEEWQISHISQN